MLCGHLGQTGLDSAVCGQGQFRSTLLAHNSSQALGRGGETREFVHKGRFDRKWPCVSKGWPSGHIWPATRLSSPQQLFSLSEHLLLFGCSQKQDRLRCLGVDANAPCLCAQEMGKKPFHARSKGMQGTGAARLLSGACFLPRGKALIHFS